MNSESNDVNINEKSNLSTRRRVLILAAVATCAFVVSLFIQRDQPTVETVEESTVDIIETKAPVYSTEPVKGIPKSWVDKQGLDVLRYANFIQDLGLENVTPYQVLYPHFKTRGRTSNTIPPKELWPNIVPTLKIVNEMSALMNAKVKPFVSVYRDSEYNRAVRGRTHSQHLTNNAVTLQFHGVTADTALSVAKKLREEGHFKGEIRGYDTHIYIDTCEHNKGL